MQHPHQQTIKSHETSQILAKLSKRYETKWNETYLKFCVPITCLPAMSITSVVQQPFSSYALLSSFFFTTSQLDSFHLCDYLYDMDSRKEVIISRYLTWFEILTSVFWLWLFLLLAQFSGGGDFIVWLFKRNSLSIQYNI